MMTNVMTKNELDRLRESLPPFAEADVTAGGETLRYLQFYGLDLGGSFAGLSHRVGTVDSGDHRLAVHLWSRAGERPLMLIVHGYLDHVGLYGHLVRFALERGHNVLALDLPGHGLSTGEPAAIDDFGRYRAALRDVLERAAPARRRLDVIAQSTGGAVVMDTLQREPELIDGAVVLLAPLVRPRSWGQVRFLHTLLRWLNGVPRRFERNSGDAEFLRFLRADPLQSRRISVQWVGALRRWLPDFLAAAPSPRPLLVVQGDADDTVDWRYNLPQIRRLFPQAETHMLKTARHHLANETEALRRVVPGGGGGVSGRQGSAQNAVTWITRTPIAHRGLHNHALPENSLGAFSNAVEHGYSIELDVRLSSDGKVVVFHDDGLRRLTGVDGAVETAAHSTLSKLTLKDTGEKIPALKDVLSLVDGRVPLLIEVKSRLSVGPLEEALAGALEGYGGEVAVQSFDPHSLRWFRDNRPDMMRGQVAGSLKGEGMAWPRKLLLRHLLMNRVSQPHFIAYEVDLLPCLAVSRLRRKGVPVLAWTVDSADKRQRAEEHADNIIFEGMMP